MNKSIIIISCRVTVLCTVHLDTYEKEKKEISYTYPFTCKEERVDIYNKTPSIKFIVYLCNAINEGIHMKKERTKKENERKTKYE